MLFKDLKGKPNDFCWWMFIWYAFRFSKMHNTNQAPQLFGKKFVVWCAPWSCTHFFVHKKYLVTLKVDLALARLLVSVTIFEAEESDQPRKENCHSSNQDFHSNWKSSWRRSMTTPKFQVRTSCMMRVVAFSKATLP